MQKHTLSFFLGILLLATLACGGGGAAPAGGSPGGGQTGQPEAVSGQNPGGTTSGGAVPGGAANGAGPQSGNAGPGGGDALSGQADVPDSGQVDIGGRTDAVQADENDNITISITDSEINNILNSESQSGSQIEDAQIKFTSAGIAFTGIVSGEQLYILFWPYVTDGTLQIDIVEATLGGMDVPAALLDEAETAVNESLSTAMGSMADAITLQSIVVTDGLLTITGSVSA